MKWRFVLAALIVAGLTAVAPVAGPTEPPRHTPGDPAILPTPGPVDDSGRAVPHAAAPRVPRSSVVWRNASIRRPEIVPISAKYAGEAELRYDLVEGLAIPTNITKGDFDEDGLADLICGYAGPSGPMITVHRANPDAIYPDSPGARQREERGTFTDAPFLEPAGIFRVAVTPDFIAAGDFDNDGHQDVVVAARGGTALQLLRGDGHGGIATAERIALGGAVTAMVAGEINRPDGLADLVVAVERESSAAVLVFEGPGGALRGEPETRTLLAVAGDLALGQFDDDDVARDLAVVSGQELLIVHGRNRWLSAGSSRRAAVPPARVQRIALPAPASRVAQAELAVLLARAESVGPPVVTVPMRLNRDAIDDLVVLTPGAGAPLVMMSPAGITFTIHNHGDGVDESPGDGICSTSDDDPNTCTLRAAIGRGERHGRAGHDRLRDDLGLQHHHAAVSAAGDHRGGHHRRHDSRRVHRHSGRRAGGLVGRRGQRTADRLRVDGRARTGDS